MAFFRKFLPKKPRKTLGEKALALVVSLERTVCVMQSMDRSDSRYKYVSAWAAQLAPVAAELAAVVRAHGSRAQAAELLIEIAPIMSELGAADSGRGEWHFLAGESTDYWNFRASFREVEHLDEEL